MITNIMKQRMLSVVKNTKRIELLGASNEVLSSKEVSWNTSLPTQSYISLTPVSIASGVDNIPEKVRLVTGTTVDFENPLDANGDGITVYEPYMEDIISKNYPIGTVVGQAYKIGNVAYNFTLYNAGHTYEDLLGIRHHHDNIEIPEWNRTDIEAVYNALKNIQGINEYEMLFKIVTNYGSYSYVSTPLTVAFGVKDKAMALTYNISDYTSSQLNYPEGVQIDINSLREEL